MKPGNVSAIFSYYIIMAFSFWNLFWKYCWTVADEFVDLNTIPVCTSMLSKRNKCRNVQEGVVLRDVDSELVFHLLICAVAKGSLQFGGERIFQVFRCDFCLQSCGEPIRFYWHQHQQADPHLSFTVTEKWSWKTAERERWKERGRK